MTKKTWVYTPQSGGRKIPDRIKPQIRQRILDYAGNHYAGKYSRIEVRFHGHFCYIDAYTEPSAPDGYDRQFCELSHEDYLERLRNTPIHLCRLRYFGNENRWSMAFYTYSNEKYEPCVFNNGRWEGTPEEAFSTSAVYLG